MRKIETAPLDKVVIVWTRDDKNNLSKGFKLAFCSKSLKQWLKKNPCSYRESAWLDTEDGHTEIKQPTYWEYLPKRPRDKKEKIIPDWDDIKRDSIKNMNNVFKPATPYQDGNKVRIGKDIMTIKAIKNRRKTK